MRLGSLFSGVGGIDLAFERAGFTVAWQVEIDRQARSVLARNWPDVPRFEDVRDVGKKQLSKVDVIAFGSPCQDLSVAGQRKGISGERSGLFFEALRIVRQLRPTFIVWENVPGAFISNRGRDFASVVCGVFECGARDIAWRVLDAQYFGLAQRRERVFLVADFRGERAGQILFEPACVCGNPPTRRQAGEDVAATIRGHSSSRGVSAPGRGGEDDSNLVIAPTLRASGVGTERAGNTRGQDPLIVAHACIAHQAKGGDPTTDNYVIACTLSGEGFDGSEDGSGRGTPIVPDLCGTIRGDRKADQNGSGAVPFTMIGQTQGVRRLTPRECERLQGLPDDWTRYDADGKEQKDGPRYRQIGNGVAVPVLEWIARRIMEAVA